MITGISAVTLIVRDMARSVAFYRAMGFELKYGGPEAAFSSFFAGSSFLNLSHRPGEGPPTPGWGRPIFHVEDVDATHAGALAAGYTPDFAPSDAPWGERYFHIHDPDGHEISFAKYL